MSVIILTRNARTRPRLPDLDEQDDDGGQMGHVPRQTEQIHRGPLPRLRNGTSTSVNVLAPWSRSTSVEMWLWFGRLKKMQEDLRRMDQPPVQHKHEILDGKLDFRPLHPMNFMNRIFLLLPYFYLGWGVKSHLWWTLPLSDFSTCVVHVVHPRPYVDTHASACVMCLGHDIVYFPYLSA